MNKHWLFIQNRLVIMKKVTRDATTMAMGDHLEDDPTSWKCLTTYSNLVSG